jgi:hypothetical protein
VILEVTAWRPFEVGLMNEDEKGNKVEGSFEVHALAK